MHSEAHAFAGKTVILDLGEIRNGHERSPLVEEIAGQAFRVEDWWDRVSGGSWQLATGNPAAIKYALRSALCRLPLDDEVLYGKVGSYGHLVHVSELGEVVE